MAEEEEQLDGDGRGDNMFWLGEVLQVSAIAGTDHSPVVACSRPTRRVACAVRNT